MEDICSILGILLVVVLLITPIGHGIWVGIAALLRLLMGRNERDPRPATCPRCGLAWGGTGACNFCGWGPRDVLRAANSATDELEITARNVRRLQSNGAIDAAAADAMLRALAPRETRESLEPIELAEVEMAPARAAVEPPPIPSHYPPPLRVRRMEDEKPAPVIVTPAPPPPPAEAKPPRRPLGEVLASFMQESNIRWGELIGGMLVIGCSIALVVTKWEEITDRRLLHLLLIVVTASVFAIGLYTEHRWKLPTTSRGLLLIASLLVPLNFMALAFEGMVPRGAGDLWAWAGEGLAIALVLLLAPAAKVLTPKWSWAFAIGVMGASVTQVTAARFGVVADPRLLMLLASLPLTFYWGSNAWMLLRASRGDEMGGKGSGQIFMLLGCTTVAAALPLAMLLVRSERGWDAARTLAPMLGLAGVPALASGLLLWRRLANTNLTGMRLAGTAVAVAGAGILVGSIALGWPHAAGMLPVAMIAFIVLSVISVLFRIPAGHALALACLTVAYLLGASLLHGEIGWRDETGRMARAIMSLFSGKALLGLVVAIAAGAEAWRWKGRHGESRAYGLVAIGVAALSVALMTAYGFGRAGETNLAWFYGVYAAAALAAAWRTRHQAAAWGAAALAGLAVVQAFGGIDIGLQRWGLAMLIYASSMTGLAVAARLLRAGRRIFEDPFIVAGVAASAVALALTFGLTIDSGFRPWLGILSARLLWTAGIWLAISLLIQREHAFSAFQLALFAGVGFGAAWLLRGQRWFEESTFPLLDPRTLQVVGMALAALALAWVMVRLAGRRAGIDPAAADLSGWRLAGTRLLYPAGGSVDDVVRLALVALVGWLALAGSSGILEELAPQNTPVATALGAAGSGWGAWGLSGSILAALLAALWIRFNRITVIACIVLAACTAVLLAERWEAERSVASATRWALGFFFLAGAVLIWNRERLMQLGRGLGWPGVEENSAGLASAARATTIILGAGIVLALTVIAATLTLGGAAPRGPLESRFFHRIGSAANYLVPLALVMAGLVGHAIRERSERYAFAAGMVLQLSVSLAYALAVVTGGGSMGTVQWVELVQLNVLAAGAYTLAWLGTFIWRERGVEIAGRRHVPGFLLIHWTAALAALVLLVIAAEWLLLAYPAMPEPLIRAAGGAWGWAALALVAAAGIWIARRRDNTLHPAAVFGLLALAGSMLALSLHGEGERGWVSYHLLLAIRGASGFLLLGLGWLASQRMNLREEEDAPADAVAGEINAGPLARWLGWSDFRGPVTFWSAMMGLLTLTLALRAADGDPQRPWWSILGLVMVSILAAALALWTLRGIWLYPMAILLNIAASIWWIADQPRWGESIIQLNLLVLALGGLAALMVELGALRPMREGSPSVRIAYHHLAAIGGAGLLALFTLAFMPAQLIGLAGPVDWWSAAAVGGPLALMIGCLWDARARYALGGVHLIGLAGIAIGVMAVDSTLDNFFWIGTLSLSVHALAWAFGFEMRTALTRFAQSVGIDTGNRWPAPGPGWLGRVIGCEAIAIAIAATLLVLNHDELAVRVAMAVAATTAAVALGLLGHRQPQPTLRVSALLLGALGAVLFGWAWLDPASDRRLLNALVVVMTCLSAVTAIYAVVLVKLLKQESPWIDAAKRLIPIIGGATIASLLSVIGAEAALFDEYPRAELMALPAFAAVAAALLALTGAALVCAVVPGKDPFGLSERGRQAYVYAAELLLILLFIHIKLCYPDILKIGIFRRFWPIIVMLLAFLGVGLSELFRRQGRRVLAEPLENSGAFLPIVPIIGYFLFDSHRDDVDYAPVLALAGMVYAILAVLRRSFTFGLLAALGLNGALWWMLHHTAQFGFTSHPQLWLIPAAFSVLAAAWLNRDRLSAEKMRTIRYVCLLTIYISSMADIWIHHEADAPWLPLVLAILSVAGVMAGIALRIQSFLFLGAIFLLVSLAEMVRYSALQVGSNWPWLVAGILLGAAIVVVFALFEKKRNEMVQLVEGLKEWER